MGLADDLLKLDELRQSGSLTDAEFQKAKSILLSNPHGPTNSQASPFVEEQIAKVRYQNELTRIDREWQLEREQYRMVGRKGQTYFPTVTMGIGAIVTAVFFGTIWTMVAISVSSVFPREGSMWFAKFLLPLVGIVITLRVVAHGITCCLRAHKLHEAQQAYKEKRAEVVPPDEQDPNDRRSTITRTA